MLMRIIFSIVLFACANLFPIQNAYAKETVEKSEAIEKLDKIVAIVNDSVISEQELNKNIHLFKSQLEKNNMQIPDEASLKEQVLQQLINSKLQLQLAERLGLEIDNHTLNQTIQDIASRNQISVDKLRETIEQQGVDYQDYRDGIREEMLITRLQHQMLGDKVIVTDSQVQQYLPVLQQQLHDRITYNLVDFYIPLSENVERDELKKAKQYAQQLLELLRDSSDIEKIKTSELAKQSDLQQLELTWRPIKELPDVFIEPVKSMKTNDVSQPIRTGNGLHVIKLLGVRGPQTSLTEIQLRHILLKADASNDDKNLTEQLQTIRKRIQQGESFEKLAEQYSQDTDTVSKGGSLGWVKQHELPPAFIKAIQTLKENEISQPIQSNTGWHLIQVTETRQVDNIKELARQQLYQQKFQEAIQKWLQELHDQAYIKII